MATNFKHQAKVLTLPTADGAESGDAFVFGSNVPGVLISDAGAASPYNAPVRTEGVFELSCKGHNGSANAALAAGAVVYWTDKDTPLDLDTAQKRFGVALEAVGSGLTATIKVLISGA